MQVLKFSLLALSLSTLFLASCKKEAKVAPPEGNTTKLFARTLKVYNADGTNSATLRFQSLSEELLSSIALDKFDFTLVKTPAQSTGDLNNLSTTSQGTLNFSEKNTNREPGNGDVLQPSDKVIYINMVADAKTTSISIEVKSKKIDDARGNRDNSIQTLYPAGVQVFFHGATSWHKVQIDNLSYNALNVSFYYNSCDGNVCSTNGDLKGTFTQYSGYNYTLYNNGWAWYSKCSRAVGTLITIAPNTYYWYRWSAWYNC
ncbi:MAG: hypothetical protein ABIN89_29760 [Chitinophagaceae bacterium]